MKRGQSAMEFLMTYGWAILIVLVALGALYFLGVFSPKTSNTYFISSPLLIQDLVIKNNGVLFKMSSNLVKEANVIDVTVNGQSCNNLNGFLYNTQINEGVYTGCALDLSDYDKISGNVKITYFSKGNLLHSIDGSYSGRKEEGSIANLFQDNNIDFNLYDNNLAFGWHGDSLIDYASGRTGTANGGVNVGGVSGYLGGGTEFDGADDYINVSHSDSLAFPEGMTISLWLKAGTNTGNSDHALVTKQANGVTKGFLFEVNNNVGNNIPVGVWIATDLGSRQIQLGTITVGQWYYLTISYDGYSIFKYYKNGILSVTNTDKASGPIVSTNADLIMGRYNSVHFNGIIDEVAIWSRALSDEEVGNLYGSYN